MAHASLIEVVEATVGAEVYRAGRARSRSLTAGRRDAPPALRGAAPDRLRGTSPIVAPPAREGPIQGLRGDDVAYDPSQSTSAASMCTRSASAASSAATADGGPRVAETNDPSEGSIASAELAARFGLHVIAPNVGDQTAATRFVGIAAHTRVDRAPRWRTALSFVTDPPGRATTPSARFTDGLNLVQLVSGRSRSRPSATASTWCSTATAERVPFATAFVEMRSGRARCVSSAAIPRRR